MKCRVQSCVAGARVSAAASGAELGARYRASCGVAADGATKRFAPPASPCSLPNLARPFRPKTPKQRHGSHRRGGATKAYQPGGLYAPRRRLAALPRSFPCAFLFGASRTTVVKQSRQQPALSRCLCLFTHLLRGFARHLANGVRESRTYRTDNQLRTIGAQNANGVQLTGLQYTLDADKRRIAESDLVNSILSSQYSYDKQDQLTGWNRSDGQTGAWNLSLGGDWKSVTYNGVTETRAHDAAHELLARNAQPLAYDPRGNLTADSEGRILTWDPENRLTSMAPAAPTNGAQAVSFIYDTQWRRVGKNVFAWNSDHWDPVNAHVFTYDGWNLISETIHNSSFVITNSFIWGQDLSGTLQGAGGIGGLLAASLNGVPVFYHYNANGNVAAISDISGFAAAQYSYNPYGKVITSVGPMAAANPFRFSTKYTDDETGLLYYGYRFYNPQLGRFISSDPIGRHGGVNLYGFVENKPIMTVDRLGACPVKQDHKTCVDNANDEYDTCTKNAKLVLDTSIAANQKTYDDGYAAATSKAEKLRETCKQSFSDQPFALSACLHLVDVTEGPPKDWLYAAYVLQRAYIYDVYYGLSYGCWKVKSDAIKFCGK